MKRGFFTPAINKAAWIVGVIATIGGAAWSLGKPPYANQGWAEGQIQVVQAQVSEQRYDNLKRQILALRVDKVRLGNRWTPELEALLQELEEQLARLKASMGQQQRR